MNTYFYAEHEYLERSIINDTYNNYVLSRKVFVKNLPIVNVSESNGYVTKGSVLMRHVELEGDEFFVAVGRDYNKRMIHYVFDCFKQSNGYMKAEYFICAAQYINAYTDSRYHPGNWINSERTETTGLASYDVPDDLCVYIFAKTPKPTTEKAGFQVFSASGNIVYDSRYKYMNVINKNDFRSLPQDLELIRTKKIAIGTIQSGLNKVRISGTYNYVNSGGVIFENGYTDPKGKIYSDIEIGVGARILDTNQSYYSYGNEWGWGSDIIVFDVTGF